MDRCLRLPLLAAAAFVLAGAALVAVWKWVHRPTPARIELAVRQWATDRTLALSDSVYHLNLGPLRFDQAGSGIGIDSIRIETDSARNARRPRPLPVVSLVLRGGRVDGLHIQALLMHRSPIEISAIRFERIEAKVRLPPAREDSAPAPSPASRHVASTSRSGEVRVLDLGRGVLPGATPDLRVARIELPSITIVVRPARDPQGQVQSVRRLALALGGVRVETGDSAGTPVYVRDIRLVAEGYRGVWSRLTSATAARVEASVGDSLLRIGGLEVRPTMSDAELRRHLRWRCTRLVLRVADVEARGVNYASLLGRAGVVVRAIDLTEPRLDLLLDRNLEADPRPQPARMPPQILRALGWRLTIDTIRAHRGTIAYGELDPRNSRPGVVTFERLDGTVSNISNDPRRVSRPMVVTASARVMGVGRFSTVLEVPLDTDRFRMRYRGSVGPMPLPAFNRFVALNTDAKLRSGQALGLRFDARVVDDSATGRVIIRYRDLKLGLAKRGGGIGDAIKRHVGSFFINNFKLRRDNPEDDGRFVVGQIARRRLPTDDLFPFLWFTLRDAFKQAMTR